MKAGEDLNTLTKADEWFKNPNIFTNIIAGLIVSIALIPEAVSFSIVAGLDPMTGLYTPIIMTITIAFAGGRPAMISGTTAAMALVVVDIVKYHGAEYLFAATILMGIIQMILGYLKIGRLLRFIPNSVMIGFMNSLAILLFITQLKNIVGISNATYFYVTFTFLIILFAPRLFTTIPAPLVGLVIMSLVYFFFGGKVMTVSDLGTIKNQLPVLHIPNIPFTLETLKIIFPYAVSMALVGLIQSLIVARILDNYTETNSNKNRESFGQGISNLFTGFFGGMAGCAVTGQSIINVQMGARARLSTFTAGISLIILVMMFGSIVNEIPMPVLTGLMVFVAYNTFDWRSFKYFKRAPKSDMITLSVTMLVSIITSNLALGAICGIVAAIITFAVKISHIDVTKRKTEADHITYHIAGQLFFASIESMLEQLNYDDDESHVTLDFKHAHLWDSTSVSAIQTAILNLEKHDKTVKIINLNSNSTEMLERMTKIRVENSQSK